jgi:hypothetical protein
VDYPNDTKTMLVQQQEAVCFIFGLTMDKEAWKASKKPAVSASTPTKEEQKEGESKETAEEEANPATDKKQPKKRSTKRDVSFLLLFLLFLLFLFLFLFLFLHILLSHNYTCRFFKCSFYPALANRFFDLNTRRVQLHLTIPLVHHRPCVPLLLPLRPSFLRAPPPPSSPLRNLRNPRNSRDADPRRDASVTQTKKSKKKRKRRHQLLPLRQFSKWQR